MTIRHMEILKAISETGSFTKAARLLYITQSAVSHAVQELETEAGTLLFDRRHFRQFFLSKHLLLQDKICSYHGNYHIPCPESKRADNHMYAQQP